MEAGRGWGGKGLGPVKRVKEGHFWLWIDRGPEGMAIGKSWPKQELRTGKTLEHNVNLRMSCIGNNVI
jgi:hypothetical protein